MKFVLAPDKFKGSLTGAEFCNAVEEGISMVFPDAEIIKKPLADGGDGTMEVIRSYLQAVPVSKTVKDPLFREVKAQYLWSEHLKTAFIEMAEASGHRLLRPDELNCELTTTLGTGQLIMDALEKGAKELLLGIGGSATNDGGMGVANALGFTFLDENGKELSPIGKNLIKVATIKPPNHGLLNNVRVKIACDVTNPFYGNNGAAHIYAGQKGASPQQIRSLDRGLKHFAAIVEKDMGISLQTIPGSGAAGGLGGGGVAFLTGELISGIDMIMTLARFEEAVDDADWIITGEGKLDDQTLSGKTISGVLDTAQSKNIPVAALCGVVTLSIIEQKKMGLAYTQSILKAFQSLASAKETSYTNLVFAAYNFSNALHQTKH